MYVYIYIYTYIHIFSNKQSVHALHTWSAQFCLVYQEKNANIHENVPRLSRISTIFVENIGVPGSAIQRGWPSTPGNP